VPLQRQRCVGVEALAVAEAQRVGTKHDTGERAGSNRGHAFGTNLPPAEKDALMEYRKMR